jgi:hypothetical protein
MQKEVKYALAKSGAPCHCDRLPVVFEFRLSLAHQYLVQLQRAQMLKHILHLVDRFLDAYNTASQPDYSSCTVLAHPNKHRVGPADKSFISGTILCSGVEQGVESMQSAWHSSFTCVARAKGADTALVTTLLKGLTSAQSTTNYREHDRFPLQQMQGEWCFYLQRYTSSGLT